MHNDHSSSKVNMINVAHPRHAIKACFNHSTNTARRGSRSKLLWAGIGVQWPRKLKNLLKLDQRWLKKRSRSIRIVILFRSHFRSNQKPFINSNLNIITSFWRYISSGRLSNENYFELYNLFWFMTMRLHTFKNSLEGESPLDWFWFELSDT